MLHSNRSYWQPSSSNQLRYNGNIIQEIYSKTSTKISGSYLTRRHTTMRCLRHFTIIGLCVLIAVVNCRTRCARIRGSVYCPMNKKLSGNVEVILYDRDGEFLMPLLCYITALCRCGNLRSKSYAYKEKLNVIAWNCWMKEQNFWTSTKCYIRDRSNEGRERWGTRVRGWNAS